MLDLYKDSCVCSIGNTFDPTYMIIGDVPGKMSVEKKQPFCEYSGILLRQELNKNGFGVNNTVLTNAIPCRPVNDKWLEDRKMMTACISRWLIREIETLRPKCILILGSKAFHAITGSTCTVEDLRDKVFDLLAIVTPEWEDSFQDKYNRYIPNMVTYHPDYIIENEDNVFNEDIKEKFSIDIKKFKELGL